MIFSQTAEAGCISSGLGFTGYSPAGSAKWDAIDNANVWETEMGLNMREVIGGWNIGITRWLQHAVYGRATFAPTLMTYLVSAIWHGFYPGYYVAFCSVGFALLVCRQV